MRAILFKAYKALPLLLLYMNPLFRIASATCEMDLDQRAEHPPMILDSNGDIVYPTNSRKLVIKKSAKIVLFCAGVSNTIEKEKFNYLELKCDAKGKFVSVTSKKNVNANHQSCKKEVTPEIIEMPKMKSLCANRGADNRKTDLKDQINLYQIGWNMESLKSIGINEEFTEQIRICRDKKTFGTLWSHYVVHGSSLEYQDKGDRPDFDADDQGHTRSSRFFDGMSKSSISKSYGKKSQKKMVKATLEVTKASGDGLPIIDDRQNFLARGHLAPDAAFVYQAEADATYFYINVAPQFQSFNNMNWKSIEKETQEIAKKRQRNIEVFTGTYDVLEYTNATDMEEPLYLIYKSMNAIPVPLEYWTIIYDPDANEAISFLGNNNPHSKDIKTYKCKNICKDIKWVKDLLDDFEDEKQGHVTCCAVKDLKKYIKYVGKLKSMDGKSIYKASVLTDYESKANSLRVKPKTTQLTMPPITSSSSSYVSHGTGPINLLINCIMNVTLNLPTEARQLLKLLKLTN